MLPDKWHSWIKSSGWVGIYTKYSPLPPLSIRIGINIRPGRKTQRKLHSTYRNCWYPGIRCWALWHDRPFSAMQSDKSDTQSAKGMVHQIIPSKNPARWRNQQHVHQNKEKYKYGAIFKMLFSNDFICSNQAVQWREIAVITLTVDINGYNS